MFPVALFVLVFGIAVAVFSGGDWRAAALGGLFSLLLAAMNHHVPLIDWLYPSGDKENGDWLEPPTGWSNPKPRNKRNGYTT